ncbi:hypothetical protein JOD54_000829 [Actinokineospora baliensis]|uniref:phage tail family protein n=1 Tax=Actinokineospora baliensis TaxID=547056 RepID=UPI00195748D1|nr:phage tail family protein [Actinokineospora baliensis]MBM7770625.1 hypothetical protein [Actinokineospora baliensis]
MSTPVPLDDWTMQYRGLLIGGPGSPYSLAAVDGLIGGVGVRTADRATRARHGETPGTDTLTARVVTLTVEVLGETGTEFSAALDDLTRAFALTAPDAPMTFRFPGVAGGGTRMLTARVRGLAAPVDVPFSRYLARVTVQLYAADPRITDTTVSRLSVPLPDPDAPGGGIHTPLRPPLLFGRPGPRGTFTVANGGTFPVRPLLRVRGPVADPQVTNLDTGQRITFATTLLLGEWLDIDTDTHEVLLNSVAPRFVVHGRDNAWPECGPGLTRLAFAGYRLDPGAAGDGSELTCEWRSAWV